MYYDASNHSRFYSVNFARRNDAETPSETRPALVCLSYTNVRRIHQMCDIYEQICRKFLYFGVLKIVWFPIICPKPRNFQSTDGPVICDILVH